MTHAELLRNHANLAIKEGGMYYSGECLSRIATVAESLEAENAKLRELVKAFDWRTENFDMSDKCDKCTLPQSSNLEPECELCMQELGVEMSA